MIYVGVDPGGTGAFSFMDGDKITSFIMPIKDNGEIDCGEIARRWKEIVGDNDYKVYVEDVHSLGQASKGSTFAFGYNVGKPNGALEAIGVEYTYVQPKVWQKVMWKGYDVIKKPSDSGKTMVNDTKAMSKMIAADMYPNADLTKSKRAYKPHDGICDAILIASYGRKINEN